MLAFRKVKLQNLQVTIVVEGGIPDEVEGVTGGGGGGGGIPDEEAFCMECVAMKCCLKVLLLLNLIWQ